MKNHYKEFFALVKDYYSDLDETCAALDNGLPIPDEEQLRLALHLILDAVDSIDTPSFWAFIKSCNIGQKVKK